MRSSIAGLLAAASLMWFVAGRQSRGLQNTPAGEPVRALTLEFGIKDGSATHWDGSVALSAGSILKIRGHHFTDKDKINEDFSWQAATTEWPTMAGGLHPNEMPDPYGTRVSAVGVTVYYRAPDDAVMRVKTTPGEFEFRLGDVPASGPLRLLASRVQASRVPAAEQITGADYEDDYPSVAVDRSGAAWVAWAAYRNESDEIFLKRAGAEVMKVSERPGDLFSTAVAVDGRGRAWVVWSERKDADWRLMARNYDGKAWSRVEALTTGKSNNLFHRLAADPRGNLHLVWQAARGGRSDIFLKSLVGDRWSNELNLSDPKRDARANDWNPAVAADRAGTVWVAWDSYAGGNYNILLRPVRAGKAGEVIKVTDSPRFHAHASLAVDEQDRLWVAYDEAEENWGKDTGFFLTGGAGLYQSRRIRCAIYSGGKWLEPRSDLNEALPLGMRRYVQSPRLVAGKGRMWVVFRPRTSAMLPQSLWAAGGKWEVLASSYAGDRWSTPLTIPETVGRNEGPFDAAADPAGRVWVAAVTDHRLYGGPNFGHPPQNNDIVVAPLDADAGPALQLGARAGEPPAALPSEPREKAQIAALRGYSINAGGKTYKIYRGDMHRHTEISLDGAGDGSLFDAYRYMMDAAGMDYFLVTDHQSGNNQEYTWWRIEKSEDMFHVPGFFTTLFGYERSVAYPNGHRNLVFTRRGIRTLPIAPREPKEHTGPILYPYLKKYGGIAMSHTSHTGMGTDWRDNDPELEPIMEIFQWALWNAWAKGYKLGVQASSDHTSTHTSYACVIAENFTRDGLVDAMRRRHTYAATSNIILDFRMEDGAGTHLQGDVVTAQGTPQLVVKIFGTAPLAKIDVVRDNQYIHSRPGAGETAEFTYRDNSAGAGEHYYYVRVQQKDRNVAWSSPIWVKLDRGS
ncbi:MAG: hypothetical protein HY238_15880 [Acidobacteria bacterium]|nr:hypothetical protein [Acidobacteriota bacterium]